VNNSKKLAIGLISLLMIVGLSMIVSAQEYDWSDEDAAVFLGLGLMACILTFALPLIISLVIGFWMYKDANKRGGSGALWFIIGFFLSLIGLIIWLVVRPPIGGEKKSRARTKMSKLWTWHT